MPTKSARNSLMMMLAVVLAAGWAGCKKSEPGAAAPAAAPGAAKPLKFAFVTNNSSDFWNIAEKGVRKAEKELGIKAVVFRPLKTEVAEQQRFIEDILVQSFDGMAICAINPDAMTPILDRVAAKMPVVVHDSDAPKSQRKAFVGTDNVAAGRLAGQAAIDALKAANISKGKVAMFVGRIDMGWDDWRVGVEYDGVQHWTDPARRTRDIDRQAELEAMGWRIVRVSADMLRYRPRVIVERTRAALRAAGCPV